MSIIIKIIKVVYWALILFLASLIVINTVPYYSFSTDFDFLLSKQDLVNSIVWRTCFYLHITAAMVSLVTGLPQFSMWVLKKHRKWHRRLGTIYVIAILYVACPSGFYLSFFTNGGIMGIIPFMSIAVLWFTTTYLSYRYIKQKDVIKHSLWMVRSYALTLSALTFRLYNVIFALVFYMDPIENYILSLWVSLLGNIVLGEIAVLYYRYTYFKGNTTSIKVEE